MKPNIKWIFNGFLNPYWNLLTRHQHTAIHPQGFLHLSLSPKSHASWRLLPQNFSPPKTSWPLDSLPTSSWVGYNPELHAPSDLSHTFLFLLLSVQFQFSHSATSNSLWPHGLQPIRLPYPSAIPGVYSNSCSSSRWCHPTISSSVVPFASCLQSFPASGSFPMSQFFPSGGQNIGVSASASVLPVNIQDWFF